MPAARRLGRLDLLLPLLATLVVFAAMCHGLDRWGGRDWDYFEADLHSARRALLVEHELPLWMPYRVGGHDAFADPQSLWASPLGALALCFGVSWGIRVFFALCAGATCLGGVWLAARIGVGPAGRALTGALLAFASPLGFYAAGGSPTFALGLTVLPWFTALVLAGDRRSLILAGALLALDLYGGDVNHFLFHSLLGAILLTGRALAERRARRLWSLVLVFGAATVFAGPKLVPLALLSGEVARPGSQTGRGAMTPHVLAHALLNRNAVRFLEAPYHEFVVVTRDGELAHGVPLSEARPETAVCWIFVGSYVGVAGLLLAVFGLVLTLWPGRTQGIRRRPVLMLGLTSLVMLWLSAGPNITPSAWNVLHELPVFSSLRSPERLILYPFLSLALFAGIGLDQLGRILRARGKAQLAKSCSLVLLAVVLADLLPPAWRAYRQSFVEPDRYQLHRLPKDLAFTQTWAERPAGSSYYGPPVAPFAAAGVGVVNGYRAVPVPPTSFARQDPRYRGEAFLEDADARLVPEVTARHVAVRTSAAAPDTLLINQNYAPGWTAVSGVVGQPWSKDGQLAVSVPAGENQVFLRYTPPGLGFGLVLLLVGAPCLFLVQRRSGQPRGSSKA